MDASTQLPFASNKNLFHQNDQEMEVDANHFKDMNLQKENYYEKLDKRRKKYVDLPNKMPLDYLEVLMVQLDE
jgi:hypothetical protein